MAELDKWHITGQRSGKREVVRIMGASYDATDPVTGKINPRVWVTFRLAEVDGKMRKLRMTPEEAVTLRDWLTRAIAGCDSLVAEEAGKEKSFVDPAAEIVSAVSAYGKAVMESQKAFDAGKHTAKHRNSEMGNAVALLSLLLNREPTGMEISKAIPG